MKRLPLQRTCLHAFAESLRQRRLRRLTSHRLRAHSDGLPTTIAAACEAPLGDLCPPRRPLQSVKEPV